jgi:NADPH-dependent curcumin reductase CurA
VVGIAGKAEKCRFVTEALGFDACVSHLSPSFADDLSAACPAGVDVFFENVGGAVFDAVLPLFNRGARMTICGLIAHYGDDGDARAELMVRGEAVFARQGVMVNSLFVGDYIGRHDEMLAYVAPLVASGRLKYREDIRQGLDAIPASFSEMLTGANFGKMLVQVGEDPTI